MSTGRLEVIHGPMFSGKSRELIRRLRAAVSAGVPTAAFKSDLDARHHRSDLTSHDGERFPASPIATEADVMPATPPPGTVGIDEVQFFPIHLVARCSELRLQGYRVITAGLLEDYRGNAFEVVAALLDVADHVTPLAARCAICGQEAHHTYRTVKDTERVVVGASERYEPRCERCFHRPS